MQQSGGEITVTLKMDNKQFLATAASSDAAGKALGNKLDNDSQAATDRVGARFATMGTVIKGALLGAGVAAGVAGVASVKMAGDFEQSMNILKSVSGATGAEFAALSEKARALGKDAALPGVSAADAANAMSELAKAGLSVNDVLGASKGVLSLAKAGQLDTAEAATIAARALNTFGLEGKDASKVADLLAAGANASTAGVSDMAQALAQGGAGAKQFGISIGDTVAALGLFSNAGINGSDAGTSLKTMLQRLAAPTDESAAAMKKLGLNFFDAKGNFVGLESTAGQLQNALGKLTTEQKNAALATIFGSDSSRVAAVLADKGAKGFADMAAAVNKQGAATDLAAAQNSGFNGALDNLKSTLETIGTDLGTKVLPPLTDFIKALAENAVPATEFLIKNGELIVKVLAGVAAAFVAIRIAGFVADLKAATSTLELFVGAKNANGITALGNAFKTVGTAILDLSKKMVTLVADFAKTAAAAVANAARVTAAWIASAAQTSAAWLVAKAQIVAHFIAMQLQAVYAGIVMRAPAVAVAVEWVASAAKSAAAWAVAFAQKVTGAATAGASMAASGLTAAANWISRPFVAAAAWATAAGRMIASMASTAAAGVSNAAKTAAAWVAGAVKTSAAWLLTGLKMLPMFIGWAIGSVIQAAIVSAAWVASAVATAAAWVIANAAILGVIGLIILAVAGAVLLIVKNWDTIVAAASAAWEWIKGAVKGFIDWIVANWPLLLAIITGPIGLAVLFIVKNFDTIKQIAGNVMNAIGSFFANGFAGIRNIIGSVVDFIASIPGKVAGFFGGFGSLLYDKGRDLINGLINGAKSLLSKIGELFLNVVPGWIKDPFKKALGINSPSKIFAGFGANITQGLANGIAGSAKTAINAAQALGDQVAGINMGIAGVDISRGGSAPLAPAGAGQGGFGAAPTIIQNNTVNNTVDSDKLISDMTWALARA